MRKSATPTALGERPRARTRCLLRLALALTLALAALALSAGSAAASTECASCAAWWHGLSVSRPTNMHAGTALSAVQELVVDATGGDVVLVEPASLEAFEKGRISFEELRLVEFPYDASVAEVQKAVEQLFPGDVVEVSGSVGRYVLTFPGQSVATINSAFGFLGGLEGEATVTQVRQGRPDGELLVTFENVGDATVDAAVSPVELQDALPAGLRAVSVSGGVPNGPEESERNFVPIACRFLDASHVGCTAEGSYTNQFGQVGPEIIPPFDIVKMRVGVIVQASAQPGESNRATVSGGATPAASTAFPVTISSSPAPFGVEDYQFVNEEAGGLTDVQAGSHPFQQTTTLVFNTSSANETSAQEPASAKDVNLRWPPGLIGDPLPFPRCTIAQFFTKTCPAASIVGVTTTIVDEPGSGILYLTEPLYDIEPSPGEAARFAYEPAKLPVFINATVRDGSDYGVTVHAENITQTIAFLSSAVTVWGTPGATVHNAQRGNGCLLEARGESTLQVLDEEYTPCEPFEESAPPPFLTLPSGCTGPLQTTVETDSWQEPHPEGQQVSLTTPMPALDGCNREPFSPSIKVTPDGQAASTPTGLTVDEHVSQEPTRDAAGLAEADQKSITVTLPEGLQLDPSAADGLEACSEAQIGYTGSKELYPLSEPGVYTPQFEPEVYDPQTGKNEVSLCPNAAKVATATVKVPVLENPLEGEVYLAAPQNFATSTGAPQENPFQSLVAMYIVAKDPVSGVIIKLAGRVELGGQAGVQGLAPGQIRATFANNPQAPFEDAILHFFGGERAPLATPALCRRGEEAGYQTTTAIVPWSAPLGDETLLTYHPTSEFEVTSGPNGAPCPNPPGDQSPSTLPFDASLVSGTTNNNGGSFSDLTTTLSRPSGNQNIQSVVLHYPPGVSGLLKGVPLCPEAQANAGTCAPESQIGETIVSVGVGGDPFTVTGGKVYLTEHYEGAPFGLSIVNPAKAGPFDLQEGRPVIVRAKVEISPITAALTVTTGDIPTMIEGFALQIQHVNVLINRPGFTFNPTSCDPMSITGTINAAEGASVSVSDPFQVANCALLKYEPKLTVTTAGHASKANGASLDFKIAYPNNPIGTQSWFNKTVFDIPKQLPVELRTIQHACEAQVFATNHSACPPQSLIGHAIVHTPVLPVPLEGPVYFVSFANEKFPEAILVLKGYGITIELTGHTFIDNKTGVTSATFENLPDVPFESIEVNIPQGPFSEFGANLPSESYDFCGQKIAMPVQFKASNGLEINQSTPVQVSGCPTTLAIQGHKVNKSTLTLHLYVPAAGKLKATGRGLSSATKNTAGTEDITLTLHSKSRHPRATTLTVRFTPTKGHTQTKHVHVRF